jgi:hypothetical protein
VLLLNANRTLEQVEIDVVVSYDDCWVSDSICDSDCLSEGRWSSIELLQPSVVCAWVVRLGASHITLLRQLGGT